MALQAAADKLRRSGICNRGRAQAVVSENRVVVGIVDRKEGLCAAQFVALPGIALQELIQGGFAAVEGLPIMPFGDRLLVPPPAVHFCLRSDFAAASNFALGLGGLSSKAQTRRLSRSQSCRCPASWITHLAAFQLLWLAQP